MYSYTTHIAETVYIQVGDIDSILWHLSNCTYLCVDVRQWTQGGALLPLLLASWYRAKLCCIIEIETEARHRPCPISRHMMTILQLAISHWILIIAIRQKWLCTVKSHCTHFRSEANSHHHLHYCSFNSCKLSLMSHICVSNATTPYQC